MTQRVAPSSLKADSTAEFGRQKQVTNLVTAYNFSPLEVGVIVLLLSLIGLGIDVSLYLTSSLDRPMQAMSIGAGLAFAFILLHRSSSAHFVLLLIGIIGLFSLFIFKVENWQLFYRSVETYTGLKALWPDYASVWPEAPYAHPEILYASVADSLALLAIPALYFSVVTMSLRWILLTPFVFISGVAFAYCLKVSMLIVRGFDDRLYPPDFGARLNAFAKVVPYLEIPALLMFTTIVMLFVGRERAEDNQTDINDHHGPRAQ